VKLNAGDIITFEIVHGTIHIKKARPFNIEFSSALTAYVE